jgi:RNA polymerase sigma-70 factor, ECF subfamily
VSVIRPGKGSEQKNRTTRKKLPNRRGIVRSNTRMGNNDHALIRAVLSGDKDAYGVLVARHGENMFRVAFRITENESDAEEIVQETFLRGYRSLPNFDARADFRTWIYRIAFNCALQVLNKRKSEAAVPITEEFDEGLGGIQLADGAAGPERLLLDREIEYRRHVAMEKMTPDERLAFVLRHLEGRSTEEIAAALQVTPNNAKQAVFRAVQKMRLSLAPLWVKS